MADDIISVSSVVSQRDYRPFVQFRWGEQGCQLTPSEARQHAYGILDAANAAESDAMMVLFLQEKVGLEGVSIAAILQDFRGFREKLNRLKASDGQNRTKI
jgi:hypothetical protein